MKRTPILLAVVASLSTAGGAIAAAPAPPGQGKIQCFNVAPGTCTLSTNGAKGTATLATRRGGVAGVYIPGTNNSLYGQHLSKVTALSFTYSGTTGVDPHWSIPIDGSDAGTDTDYFVSVAAGSCNNGLGVVDVINDPTCTIFINTSPLVSYPNWAAYVASDTNLFIANDINYAFVIADSTVGGGVWTVGNLTLGKPGK